MRRLHRLVLLASLLFAQVCTAFAADETLVSAKQYLDRGNPQAAYNLLAPLQADRAGDAEYDFLLGAAALELGKNTEAVFALERVLAVRPDAVPARALIARAYFNLKEIETAKREFENVKRQEVPSEVALTIDRFLDAIGRIEESQRTTIRGHVEVAFGYDANVNGATADAQVAVPFFGGTIFTLGQASQEQDDWFFSFGGGVNLRVPINPRWSAFGGAAFQSRNNFHEDNFSTYYYDLNAGISYKHMRNTISLAGQINHFYVDNPQLYRSAYREALGGTLQWQHDFNSRNQMSAFVQFTELRYPDQSLRNADRQVAGVGYARAFVPRGPIVYLGVYGGEEKEKEKAFPHFGHTLYGARLGVQQSIGEKYAVFLNGSAEKRDYGGPDPFFLIDREDKQYNASAGIHFVPRRNMRLTPQVNWIQNDSNISINEFDRIIGSLVFRYDM
jgi:tetratricopeptide (TPR) repeat protein